MPHRHITDAARSGSRLFFLSELMNITKKGPPWEDLFHNSLHESAGHRRTVHDPPRRLFFVAGDKMSHDDIATQFEIQGELASIIPFTMGHIHDSFVSTWQTPHGLVRYVHQRLNQNVFSDIGALMRNIRRVTEHLRLHPVAGEKLLTLIPARTGEDTWIDGGGSHWRTFSYIENTEVFNLCPDAEHAFEAGRIFASFVARLKDLRPASLATTIPDFFDTPARVRQLEKAIAQGQSGKLNLAVKEVDFVLQRKAFCSIIAAPLAQNLLPERVIHFDPKLNNVLFDRDTGKAVCVVDLDTCMPGSLLYDFGDLVRTAGVDTVEDEPDASKIRLNLYEALLKGYVECLGQHMDPAEVRLLAQAPRLATLTIGMRFLADYIGGDTYFKVEHPEHNLQRARAQFALVRSMEQLEPEMERIVSVLSGRERPEEGG